MSSDREFDEIFANVVLGYGGMIVEHGVGSTMPEHEAFTAVVPLLLERRDAVEDVVVLCLAALHSQESEVSLVALKAFIHLAQRSSSALPRREEVVRAIEPLLKHADPILSSAAATALQSVTAIGG
jgi:hypothetical protein